MTTGVLAITLAILALAAPAFAQHASTQDEMGSAPEYREEMSATIGVELTSPRPFRQPPPKPRYETVWEDAERAISEIKARERAEKLSREAIPRPHPRPDLNYDVVNGIQSRNITNSLRPR